MTGRGDVVGAAIAAHGDVDLISLTGDSDDGQADPGPRRGQRQARPPRARRQGAVHRLRGCRPRGGRARRDGRRADQRRAGLHGGHPGLRPPLGLRPRSWRGPRSCSTGSGSATRSTPRPISGTLISQAQVERVDGFVRACRGGRRADRRGRLPAGRARPAERRLLPADDRRRLRAGQRDRPERGLRTGPRGPPVRHRRRGA